MWVSLPWARRRSLVDALSPVTTETSQPSASSTPWPFIDTLLALATRRWSPSFITYSSFASLFSVRLLTTHFVSSLLLLMSAHACLHAHSRTFWRSLDVYVSPIHTPPTPQDWTALSFRDTGSLSTETATYIYDMLLVPLLQLYSSNLPSCNYPEYNCNSWVDHLNMRIMNWLWTTLYITCE